jgi:hypothetical protein
MCIRPQSDILILVDSWPPTPKIWWPNSNFSGQRKEKLVAKTHGKKVKTNISRSFALVIFVHAFKLLAIVFSQL